MDMRHTTPSAEYLAARQAKDNEENAKIVAGYVQIPTDEATIAKIKAEEKVYINTRRNIAMYGVTANGRRVDHVGYPWKGYGYYGISRAMTALNFFKRKYAGSLVLLIRTYSGGKPDAMTVDEKQAQS